RPEGPVRQQEFIYLTPGPRRDPVGDLTAAHAEDGILRWRWWTRRELAESQEALWPPQLPDIIANALRAAPNPPEPVHLGYVPNERTNETTPTPNN
ncbi:MAG: hypothetical protein ACRDSS_13390, partial [Actinocrinis sp.]